MSTIVVDRAGPMTTVQDWPGRIGYWGVGVPPSGPMDDLSFRLANTAVGNLFNRAGLPARPFRSDVPPTTKSLR